MKSGHINSYSDILGDFYSIVRREHNNIAWAFEDETSPLAIDLSFSPPVKREVLTQYKDTSLCTLCERRISYKQSQFEEKTLKLPYLILIHNSFLSGSQGYFQEKDENDLFVTIIEKTFKQKVENFLVREVLRCHFGKDDIKDETHIQNCGSHISNDIDKYKIKGILIMGDSAPLLFPDKKFLADNVAKVIEFHGLPSVISPGPARLLHFQKRKSSAEVILNEKKRIFKAVNTFKTEVMGG